MPLTTLVILTLSTMAAPGVAASTDAGAAPALPPRTTKSSLASKPLPLPESPTKQPDSSPSLTLSPSASAPTKPVATKPLPTATGSPRTTTRAPLTKTEPTTTTGKPASSPTISSEAPQANPSTLPGRATRTTASSNAPPVPRTGGTLLPIAPCLVSLIEDVEVPALEAGAITQLNVEEGAIIKQGQLLALIDDRQPRNQKKAAELERDAALAKASDDIEVRYSEAALDFSNAELNRLLSLEKKGSGAVSASDIEKARLAMHRDELQIDRSKLELKVAKMTADVHQAQVDAADESVQRRKVTSPLDGEVIQILHERGEWVAAGEPILQVVRMDFLRVEGFVSISEAEVGQIANKPVQVEVNMAGGRKELFDGEVVFVSPMVHAGGKYRVRAEVANRTHDGQWLLRPGMSAVMNISVK